MAKGRHLGTVTQLYRAVFSQLRHVGYWQSGKKLVKQQYLFHMSSQYGELRNFNEFRLLASILHRHHATEVNQTLHNVCPSP